MKNTFRLYKLLLVVPLALYLSCRVEAQPPPTISPGFTARTNARIHAGSVVIEGFFDLGSAETFADGDQTPDVSGGAYFNTHSSPETIEDFDAGGSTLYAGQVITVFSKGATTFDEDGGLLEPGNEDIITTSGDVTTWMYNGEDWVLLSYMNNAVDQSLGKYRLEAEDHTHASTGMQAGLLDHGSAIIGLDDDDHSLYLQNTEIDTEAKLEAIVGNATNIIVQAEIDSESQLEALVADMANIIQATEIDSEAELESLISNNLITTNDLQTSAHLAGFLSNETGTGLAVFGTSPTLITPALGTPASGDLSNCEDLPIAEIVGLDSDAKAWLESPSAANLQAANVGDTGSGLLVFQTSPTFVTPLLGTPTSGNLANCTNLPIATGVSGLGANVATFLATPSSANLASAVTGEQGSGALVFATNSTLTTPSIDTSLTVTDDAWIGLGASAARIEYDDDTVDLVEILAGNVRIGDGTPSSATSLEDLYVEGDIETGNIVLKGATPKVSFVDSTADEEDWSIVTGAQTINGSSEDALHIIDDTAGAVLASVTDTEGNFHLSIGHVVAERQVVAISGIETLSTSEAKGSFITMSDSNTINLPATATAGMEVTILVIADAAVTIYDNAAGDLIWKDGSTDTSIVCSGSAGECITLTFVGSLWYAHTIEGSWILQ